MTAAWFELALSTGLVLLGAGLVFWRLKHRLQEAQRTIASLEQRLDVIALRQTQAVATLGREAHNALNGITGYAEYVAHNATDPMIRFTGTIIYESSLKLLRTTDVMLDLMRHSGNNSSDADSHFSLRACFDTLRREFAFSLQEKTVLLETHVTDEVPELLYSKAQYVQKIVANLTENAIRFCAEGGRVRLHAELAEDQHYVHIRVEDNGAVLPDTRLQALFEHGQWQTSPVSTPLGDAGSTLLVAHQLATNMDGWLCHTPTTDKGNMFHFFFPLLSTGSAT